MKVNVSRYKRLKFEYNILLWNRCIYRKYCILFMSLAYSYSSSAANFPLLRVEFFFKFDDQINLLT